MRRLGELGYNPRSLPLEHVEQLQLEVLIAETVAGEADKINRRGRRRLVDASRVVILPYGVATWRNIVHRPMLQNAYRERQE
jgi:hypothetical protein